MEFKVSRKEAESIGWNSGNPGESPGSCETFHQGFMILSVLLDIRDLLTPKPVVEKVFDPEKFPNDLGPGSVEFCTDMAAFLFFERKDLGKLFVPFSRMAPGVQAKCENEESFDEFFVGDWMYDRLRESAKGHAQANGNDRPAGSPYSEGDIPF